MKKEEEWKRKEKREEFENENRRREEENRRRYEEYMRFQQQEQERQRQLEEQNRQNEYYRQMEIQRQTMLQQQQQQQQLQQQQMYQQMYTQTTYQQPVYTPYTTTTTYVQPQPQPQVTVTKTIKTDTKKSKFPITRLSITVIRCRRLAKKDTFSKADPYIVMMLNQQRQKTNWIKNTQNPVFNHDFEFRGVLEQDEVVLNVMDHDTLSRDKFLGEVRLNKKDFINGSESWFPLQSRQGRYDRVHGDILIRFTVL